MTLIYDIKQIRTDQIISSTTTGWNRVYKIMQADFEAQRIIDLRLREYKFFTREPEINDFTLDKPSILQFPAKLKETNATD